MADLLKDSTGTVDNITSDISFDKDYDIINSYNFVLRVEGLFNVAVKSIRGINKQNEYEYIQEGGLNDYVHMVRKQISQPFTFQVERYVSQDIFEDFIDPLANGTELTLPLILYIYRGAKKDGKLPVRYYVFMNARVIGMQAGDLDAEKSGLHTITNTIAYGSLITFTLPWGTTDYDNIYKFNKDGKENTESLNARTWKDVGMDENHRGTRTKTQMEDLAIGFTPPDPRGQLFQEEMEEKAQRYEFGSEPSDKVVIPNDQKSKSDMEGAAEKYKFKKDEKTANNTHSKKVVSPNEQLTKSQMEESAEQYDFATNKNTPTKKVKTPEGQLTKEKMKRKAQKSKYSVVARPSKKVTQPEDQFTKKNMESSAIKHKFGGDATEGVVQPEGQLKKDAMEGGASKYTYNSPASSNVIQPKGQLKKDAMEGGASKYTYNSPASSNVIQPEGQLKKDAMEGGASKYTYNSPASSNVVQPEGQLSKDEMAAAARKFPAQRSARQVSDFLNNR